VGLSIEFKGQVESMCPEGLRELLSETQDEAWNFFEKLGWDTYEVEQARRILQYPTHYVYAFYVNSHLQDHFMNPCDYLSLLFAPCFV